MTAAIEELRGPGLAPACFAVTGSSGLLVLGAALSLGPLPTWAVACAFAVALRSKGHPPPSAAALVLGAGAGFLSYPAWLALLIPAGLALGLPPRDPPPGYDAVAVPLLSFGLLGPVFEELVYREKLLPALETRVGRGMAVVSSAAAFALPHLEPWTVLTTFLLGLGLGTLFLRFRRVAPCIGLHAGLNLAAMACGVPPMRWALGPLDAAIAGALLLALATRRS